MSDAKRILIVDDEPDIIETLDFALRRRGYVVAAARDGHEALQAARRDPPDLMLLDVMLPGVNGYEVSRKLKHAMIVDPDQPRFPILLLTARRVNSVEREEFVSTWSRADGVVYKPFALDRLIAELEELMADSMVEEAEHA